jgi:hypothetical protein
MGYLKNRGKNIDLAGKRFIVIYVNLTHSFKVFVRYVYLTYNFQSKAKERGHQLNNAVKKENYT